MVESSLYRLVGHMNTLIHYFPNYKFSKSLRSECPAYHTEKHKGLISQPAVGSATKTLGVSLSIYTFQLRSLVCELV